MPSLELTPKILSGPLQSVEQWYAIETRYRFERRVAAQLEIKGVHTYLPLLQEVHQWSDRRKVMAIPLFSGYGFVHMELSPGSRIGVLDTTGVIRFVTLCGKATAIPHRQIEDLRLLLSQNVPCALHAFLKIGQRVRIRGGCLEGLEGVLEHNEEKNLVISIESIERAVAIRIEGYELELV
jgi:transcription antitermination factor NusG